MRIAVKVVLLSILLLTTMRSAAAERAGPLFRVLTSGKPFRLVAAHPDAPLLRRITRRLARSAMTTPPRVAIVELPGKPSFRNAITVPGGGILVSRALLDYCKRLARAGNSSRTSVGGFSGKYESILSAILAHELGHDASGHYGRAAGGTLKSSTDAALRRRQEFEADAFAIRILNKSGYDIRYLALFIRGLGGLNSRSVNPYLATHPTTHARLARLVPNPDDRRLHARMARLEFAFASVQTGTNLRRAAGALRKELRADQDNPYLRGALARVYHRLWEASCRIDELLFKTTIVYSPFRDKMVASRVRKSGRRICGNRGYYFRASRAYEAALRKRKDFALSSGFAALLCYDRRREKEALRISREALRASGGAAFALNNHAIVLYFNGRLGDAERWFLLAADGGRTLRRGRASREDDLLRSMSRRNLGRLREARFNLGQLYYVLGSGKRGGKATRKAVRIWRNYLKYLDSSSDWAQYAAGIVKFRPGRRRFPPMFRGVAAGYSFQAVLNRWGRPTREDKFISGTARLDYSNKGAFIRLNGGKVESIRIVGPNSGPFRKNIVLGMRRGKIEKILGPPPAFDRRRSFYEEGRLVFVFDDDVLNEIIINQ